jgi:hypothetical protein
MLMTAGGPTETVTSTLANVNPLWQEAHWNVGLAEVPPIV